MKWILVNIGCIECGISSNIVGIFTDMGHAQNIQAKLEDKANWRKEGDNRYEIFPMPEEDVINEEYLPYIEPDQRKTND